jgi:hypothetical protein
MKTVDFNNIDYLSKYIVNDRLDLPRLINDDFFLAIKLCYNKGYYTSATKLLMCFVDSISYVASGKSSATSFQEYLNKYCDLEKVGVTSYEVWEHRNGILHMTNLESRKITQGQVKRLISYVGTLTGDMPKGHKDTKYFSLYDFMIEVGRSIGRYIDFLNKNPNEYESFFKRYDEIVSDVRKSIATISE